MASPNGRIWSNGLVIFSCVAYYRKVLMGMYNVYKKERHYTIKKTYQLYLSKKASKYYICMK